MSAELKFITPDDLAATMGIPRESVMRRVVKQAGFPQPVDGWRVPRWLEAEVVRFFRRKSAPPSTQSKNTKGN